MSPYQAQQRDDSILNTVFLSFIASPLSFFFLPHCAFLSLSHSRLTILLLCFFLAQSCLLPLSPWCIAGEDYVPADLGVVFSVGVPDSQELCYLLTLIDDDIIEEEEYFSIEIVSVSQGAVVGSPNVTNINIIDNDGENNAV